MNNLCPYLETVQYNESKTILLMIKIINAIFESEQTSYYFTSNTFYDTKIGIFSVIIVMNKQKNIFCQCS